MEGITVNFGAQTGLALVIGGILCLALTFGAVAYTVINRNHKVS